MTKRSVLCSVALVVTLLLVFGGVAFASPPPPVSDQSRPVLASSSESTVIIATGLNFPDALSGGLLSSAYEAPLLLVEKDGVPSAVASEITRRRATRAIILGGETVVSSKVATALRNLGVTTVERVQGSNRYSTSAALAERASAAVDEAKEDRLQAIQGVVADAFADLKSQIDAITERLDAVESGLADLETADLVSRIDALESARASDQAVIAALGEELSVLNQLNNGNPVETATVTIGSVSFGGSETLCTVNVDTTVTRFYVVGSPSINGFTVVNGRAIAVLHLPSGDVWAQNDSGSNISFTVPLAKYPPKGTPVTMEMWTYPDSGLVVARGTYTFDWQR